MEFAGWLVLTEGVQEIERLGFPRVVAEIIQRMFGKNAHLVARWNKENSSRNDEPNWWRGHNSISFSNGPNVVDLVDLYESAPDPERYRSAYRDVYDRDPTAPPDLESLEAQIEDRVRKSRFFTWHRIVTDILDGTLTDLKPYRDLAFEDAAARYERKSLFRDREPLRAYPDGWRWIDVGPKCDLLRGAMKNCGSVGVMSWDPDSTIVALFDKGGKPHVMTTWSPKEKRISGVEGAASSPIKDKYSDHVVDLARHLGARVDTRRTSNKIVKIKWIFGPGAEVETMHKDALWEGNNVFRVRKDGKEYLASGSYAAETTQIEFAVRHLEEKGRVRRGDRWQAVKMALSDNLAPEIAAEVPEFRPFRLEDEKTDY